LKLKVIWTAGGASGEVFATDDDEPMCRFTTTSLRAQDAKNGSQ
jgi:hypothetical protein